MGVAAIRTTARREEERTAVVRLGEGRPAVVQEERPAEVRLTAAIRPVFQAVRAAFPAETALLAASPAAAAVPAASPAAVAL